MYIKKVISNARIEDIRMIESSPDASYQIHHPNDFVVGGRVFVFSFAKFARDSIADHKHHLHRIEKLEKITLILRSIY